MGGSSHRIEILLLGAIMLLAGALVLLAPLLPQADVLPMRVEAPAEAAAALASWLAAQAPQPADLRHLLHAAGPALADGYRYAASLPAPAYIALLALLAVAAVRPWRHRRLWRALRRPPFAGSKGWLSRLSAWLRPIWLRLTQLRIQRRQVALQLDLAPDAPFLLDLPPVPDPEPVTADLLSDEMHDRADDTQCAHQESAETPRVDDAVPQDVAQTVAAALSAEWGRLGLRSHVLGLDVEEGAGRVSALVDPNPAEESDLLSLPSRLTRLRPGWSASWRRGILAVAVTGCADIAADGPLVAPLLRHGRGGRTTRYLPLGWDHTGPAQHLGIYGGGAAGALHALLVRLLYTHSPRALALAVLDSGQISPLYAGAPHLVHAPGGPREALASIGRALRHGWQRERVRPLLLVAVEPNEALLPELASLVRRLRQRPVVPLHLVVLQRHVSAEGRELYALLPALLTSGGQGDARLVHGRAGWPRRGEALLIAHGAQLAGRPLVMHEGEVRAAVEALGLATDLPPVLWDVPDLQGGMAGHDTSPVPTASSDASSLAARLGRAIDGLAPLADNADTPSVPTEDHWPAGPAGLAPADVEHIVRRMLAEETIVQATPPGVTRGRIAALLPLGWRGAAPALMAWLDAAGVLAEPANEGLRWREPRPLRSDDLRWIAAKLTETPLPIEGR